MISISVPNEPRALAAAAEFFKLLSGETIQVDVEEAPVPCDVDSTSIDPIPAAPESIPEPAAVFAPTPVPAEIPTPPVVPAGVQVDAAGIPWDSRIHSSSRAFVADGTWRLRRNLDPNILASVKAELGQAMGAPVAPPPPAAPVVPPPPSVTAAPAVLTFPGLLQKITAAGITKEQATAAAVKLGLPSFALVATRPDLLPAMAAELGVA